MNGDQLLHWRALGTVATAVIVLSVPAYLLRAARTADEPADRAASFVGRESCRPCHQQAWESWKGSDHDLAMDEADESTVLGDFEDAIFVSRGITSRFFRSGERFMVNTEGPDGALQDFEVRYTFGHEPLQQYLVPFPGGRLQCLTIAWDADEGRWFDLYPNADIPPGDWLHWTRNAQNWNGMCAECHSTNLRKGYDPESQTYETTWTEIDVSCEACHGPGSHHLEWALIEPMARPELEDFGLVVKTSDLSSTEQVELCAPCHSRRSELGDYDHTSVALLDHMLPTVLSEGLYHSDGQILDEVYVWASFTQSKMFANDVRCSDCHDAHSLKPRFEGNALCLQCHRADAYDSSDHHFHKKIHEGKPSDGALCIKCHMPETTYMVIDERADHSLRIPRPDLAIEIGTPNACNQRGCHPDRSAAWSAGHFRIWYGQARKAHYGTTLAAGREGRPEAAEDLVRLAGDQLYPAIVRATALSLLGRYPGPETARMLAVALADEDALTRHTAVTSVAPSDAEELVDLVAPLLFDPIRAVRTQAAVRLADAPRELLKPYQVRALEDGIEEYEATMRYSLDFTHAGHNLGNLYARLGRADEAIRYFRRAIEVDDLFFPAKVNLAVVLNSLGHNAEAEALLRQVLDAYPEHHEVSYSLGLLLAEMGRYQEAAVFLRSAAEAMPDHPRARHNLRQIEDYLRQTGQLP